MSEAETEATTLRFLFIRHAAYMELQDQRQRQEWERARYLAYYIISPHAKKGKLKKPQDLHKFEWECPTIKVSKEAMEALRSKLEADYAGFFDQPNPYLS